ATEASGWPAFTPVLLRTPGSVWANTISGRKNSTNTARSKTNLAGFIHSLLAGRARSYRFGHSRHNGPGGHLEGNFPCPAATDGSTGRRSHTLYRNLASSTIAFLAGVVKIAHVLSQNAQQIFSPAPLLKCPYGATVERQASGYTGSGTEFSSSPFLGG